ncbi:LacI family DNA-binding transcriptional regulator [Staphylococcus nepalensis]|nr:LacI family DNA-binding transcriptional regulator [Staphylococcus nepalensis]
MDKKNLSIKEIAEISGVSVATVSRVINQNGRFSKETEKKY